MPELSEVVAELYAVDPADFIPVRTQRIKDAKAAGDRDLATEIGKLRKPTLVAWAVNIAARELASEINGLLQLGDALREAQRRLSGSQLKALTSQRQQLVGTLARRVADVAQAHGHELSETAVREVNQTLHAALADPEIATKVAHGTLVASASYSGFGPAGLAPVRSTPAPAPDALEEARAELDRARREHDKADDTARTARLAADAARERLDAVDARILQLRDELDRAEQERHFARSAERAADDARRSADRALHDAQLRVEDAEDAMRR